MKDVATQDPNETELDPQLEAQPTVDEGAERPGAGQDEPISLESLGVKSLDELKQAIDDSRNKKDWGRKYSDIGKLYNEVRRMHGSLAQVMQNPPKTKEFRLPTELQQKFKAEDFEDDSKWMIQNILDLQEQLKGVLDWRSGVERNASSLQRESKLEAVETSYLENHPEAKKLPNLNKLLNAALLEIVRLPLETMDWEEVVSRYNKELDETLMVPGARPKPKFIGGGGGGGGGPAPKPKPRSEMTEEERRADMLKFLETEEVRLGKME